MKRNKLSNYVFLVPIFLLFNLFIPLRAQYNQAQINTALNYLRVRHITPTLCTLVQNDPAQIVTRTDLLMSVYAMAQKMENNDLNKEQRPL